MLLGSIEAGGTKFVCAVGDENYQVKQVVKFPTTTPTETFRKCLEFFRQFVDLKAVGIASFGPIDTNPKSTEYGYITTTPKPGWKNIDFLGIINQGLQIPVSWTTDVNGSAYGEWLKYQQKGRNISALIYYTVGTGIGAGIVLDGHFVGTQGNPELGHIYVKRHPDDQQFAGVCPYHHDCLEGLAAGPSIEARLGIPGPKVAPDNHVWQLIAYYLAQAAITATLSFRPEKIVFGGGVASERLLKMVRQQFKQLLKGYVEVENLKDYIVVPQIKNNESATIGNFALAKRL
jgi:fructokinase